MMVRDGDGNSPLGIRKAADFLWQLRVLCSSQLISASDQRKYEQCFWSSILDGLPSEQAVVILNAFERSVLATQEQMISEHGYLKDHIDSNVKSNAGKAR